jgi:hypothetical protein
MTADNFEMPRIIPVAEKGVTNVATLVDIPVNEDTLCSTCGAPVEVGKTYAFPECGHLICEECLENARGGNLANINVGDAENFQRRRCGICQKRFRFGSGVTKYKLCDEKKCVIM